MANETITLGGGCFWCLEAAFQEIPGVESVTSGYAGGTTEDPDYKQVCSGATGHAEVVQVRFDNDQVDARRLLEHFFAIHDPTTLNRQGADVGTQYRSVVFFHTYDQEETAKTLVKEMEAKKLWADPVVTEILPISVFYPAEDYHQNYYRRNPTQQYCQVVISPKLSKFRARLGKPNVSGEGS